MSIEPYFILFYNAFNEMLIRSRDESARKLAGRRRWFTFPVFVSSDHKAKRKFKIAINVRRLTMDMIKVAATSRTSAVAGAIAGVVREHHRAEVQAIGAGAVNQAVKALVLATGYLKSDGINVTCVPEFADVTIEDKVRTAIKLVVEPQD
jgi:stage V sporulation protein S